MIAPNRCAAPYPHHNTFANIMEHVYGWCARHRRRVRTTCRNYGSFFPPCGPERCSYLGWVCTDPLSPPLCSPFEPPYRHGTPIGAECVSAWCPRLRQRGCFILPATPAT